MTAGCRTRKSGVRVDAVVRRSDCYGVIAFFTHKHTPTHTRQYTRQAYHDLYHTAFLRHFNLLTRNNDNNKLKQHIATVMFVERRRRSYRGAGGVNQAE